MSLINVHGIDISITTVNKEDYISLTDMIRAKDGDFVISDWLRNKDTIEYIGTWECLYNPNFNYGEFTIIRNESGSRAYRISIKDWSERTNAIGIISKTGRYGGTYAHKDIAFNFGMWISPVFQLYVVKEYQRLKEVESNQYNLEWNVRRVLSKVNYAVHTNAIKTCIIQNKKDSEREDYIYASEADMLNIIKFGCTAKKWREDNPHRTILGENIRDTASINDLTILSNLETLNASLIKKGVDKETRFQILNEMCKEQEIILGKVNVMYSIKKLSGTTYIESQEPENLSSLNKALKTALNYNPND